MTSALVQLEPAAELHACLDRTECFDYEQLDAQGHAEQLQALTRVEARIASRRLRLLALAERRRTAVRSGAASTGQWAAQLANSDQVVAQRQVSLATALDERVAARRALANSEISVEHAAVIVQADRQLPTRVTLEQRVIVERSLVGKAQVLSPGALRKAARRALAAIEADAALVDAHENELVANREERAWTKTRLTLHDNDDGTVTGHFTIPVLQGHLLRKILETITAPRRSRLGASRAQAGHPDARTDWDRARGEAFCEVLEHLPTDHLHPRTAATLVVTIEEPALRTALKVAHLDTDEALSAGEARRLACNARLLPVVLSGRSLPLDLGRSARLFSEAQRTALTARHKTCATVGCERPFAWTEVHHREPWSGGGRTDLSNAIPLCHFHHQRIHDHRYDHTQKLDGSIVFEELT